MNDSLTEIVRMLRELGIKFVGIDFDHTGGNWQGSVDELAVFVRTEFTNLVPVLLNSEICVAIVTFSGQTDIVEGVLRKALGDKSADEIVIRARDGTWGSDSMRGGKQRFLKSAAEEFSQRRGITITLGSTLLIDDDEINVEFAQQGGSFALLFDPEDPTRFDNHDTVAKCCAQKKDFHIVNKFDQYNELSSKGVLVDGKHLSRIANIFLQPTVKRRLPIMNDQCNQIIGNLRNVGINLVGIDFDMTFVSQHTGGYWEGSVDDLAVYSRAEFTGIIPALLKSGFCVAIVTFSGQTDIIEGVLRKALGDENASQIVIRARDGSWGSDSMSGGKQTFLQSAAEEFQRRRGTKITSDSMLLIDDDKHNIELARLGGSYALWFNPNDPTLMLTELKSMPPLPSAVAKGKFQFCKLKNNCTAITPLFYILGENLAVCFDDIHMTGFDKCFESIDVLRKIGINFVAIDFDQTFISEHTDGRWPGSADDLAVSARAEFRTLVPVLLESGIHVAIVTFSGQTNLIEGVLRKTLGDKYANQIVIRAQDGSWGTGGPRDTEGKQKFMASAAQELEKTHLVTITRNTTLLIDDDTNNIKIALKRGVRAIWFVPEEPRNLLAQIKSLPILA